MGKLASHAFVLDFLFRSFNGRTIFFLLFGKSINNLIIFRLLPNTSSFMLPLVVYSLETLMLIA